MPCAGAGPGFGSSGAGVGQAGSERAGTARAHDRAAPKRRLPIRPPGLQSPSARWTLRTAPPCAVGGQGRRRSRSAAASSATGSRPAALRPPPCRRRRTGRRGARPSPQGPLRKPAPRRPAAGRYETRVGCGGGPPLQAHRRAAPPARARGRAATAGQPPPPRRATAWGRRRRRCRRHARPAPPALCWLLLARPVCCALAWVWQLPALEQPAARRRRAPGPKQGAACRPWLRHAPLPLWAGQGREIGRPALGLGDQESRGCLLVAARLGGARLSQCNFTAKRCLGT